MKIVVLDGYPLNSGDLDWAPLRAVGELSVFDRTAPDEIEPRARNAEVLLTIRTALNRETIRHLTNLRFIGILGSEPGSVNAEAARKRNVVVQHLPGIDAESVAQHTMALLLELTNACGHHAHAVRNGRWQRSQDFTFRFQSIHLLHGAVMGLLGYGAIGRVVARMAAGFGMQVHVCDPVLPSVLPPGIQAVSADELFARSDVLSLHCALTPLTERVVNQAALARMKPGSYLLNTAHGALVDEDALALALNNRHLAGAAMDVLSSEPPSPKNPLLRAPRCLITPRLGWAALEIRRRIIETVAQQIAASVFGVAG